ncbi:hypothetical protein BHE90_004261 [Fusarium euwallaceae]|uniref:Myb-like domain-containing protein n=2 Tax=Fusarium solani species complex TaxID=232080 RepID=A0A3M2SK01_9HYPO|nr:hypothetical protein CDV36_002449 [Fusarium kuroshium]RTE81233.1 hypothetical protein BHE90_004261 [Fusarium euwallaceae]
MAEGAATGKANAWTEEAKNEFLLRIIMQLKPEGKGINWSEIQMPGRTVKSLQNQWTAVNKKIDAIRQQQQDGGDAPSVPVKKATPRKRKVNKKVVDSEDDDDGTYVGPKKSGSRKRANTETPERAAKAIKAEAAELEDFQVKDEPAFEADSEHGQV